MNSSLHDFDDDLLDLIESGTPQRVVLASVHRPTFTQQLTVLHSEIAGFSVAGGTPPSPALRTGIRALDH